MEKPTSPGDKPNRTNLERSLDRVRAGASDELEQLLDGCRRYISLVSVAMLDRRLQSKLGASDLVQDTLLEAHDCFDRFEGETEEELFAWLTTILKRRWYKSRDHFYGTAKRDVGREESLDGFQANGSDALIEEDATPSAAVIARDEEQLIRRGMARLPEEYRRVLILRNWERKSFGAIGKEMNRSPDAVRKLWGRAVEKLTGQLSQIK